MSHGHHGITDQQQLDYFFNSFFSHWQQRKYQSSALLALCEGNPLVSLHKGPVILNVWQPCHLSILSDWVFLWQPCESVPLPDWVFLCLQVRQCNLCQKAFHDTSTLRRHIKQIHLQVRAYQCPVCGRHFTQKANMHSHMHRMHAQQTFGCQTCFRAFASQAELQEHQQRLGHL